MCVSVCMFAVRAAFSLRFFKELIVCAANMPTVVVFLFLTGYILKI